MGFYDHDEFLVHSVRDFVVDALRHGDSAVVVATEEHRSRFALALTEAGVDLDAALRRGRYRAHDASDTLSRFMVGGRPDSGRFHRVVGGVVADAGRDGGAVRIYGEMVAVLRSEGNTPAAAAVEDLWNQLAGTYRFSLFCAYPMSSFDGPGDAAAFAAVCDQHRRVIPAEGYSTLERVDDQLREVAELQRVARAAAVDRVDLQLKQRDLAGALRRLNTVRHRDRRVGRVEVATRPLAAVVVAYLVVHLGIADALVPGDLLHRSVAADNPLVWAGVAGLVGLGIAIASLVPRRLNRALWATAVAGEQLLAEAERVARQGSWQWSVPTGSVSWTPELARLFRVGPAGQGSGLGDLLARIHTDDRVAVEGALRRLLETGDSFAVDLRTSGPGGRLRWISLQGQVTERDRHGPTTIGGTARDVTERREAEQQLERSRDAAMLLQRVTIAANEAVSFEAAMSMALEEVCGYTGWPVGHVYRVERGSSELIPTSVWHLDDPERFEPFRRRTEANPLSPGTGLPSEVASSGAPASTVDLASYRTARYRSAVACGIRTGFAVPVMEGEEVAAVLEFFATEHDELDAALLDVMNNVGVQLGRVTERWRAGEALAHQALHDSLTGLANRALFLDRVSHVLTRRAHGPGHAVALFLDLDRFKVINDSLGHDAGDQVLVTVARRLASVVRPNDTVARLGGDEFTILCEDIETDEALVLAERIADVLAVPISVKGRELAITTSIGVAVARDGSATDLLREADMAMYRAKQEGRARFAVFEPRMHAAARDRLEITNELRRAVTLGELHLQYQPLRRLADGRIVAVEALVRWHHPRRGLLRPRDFIPVAEESNLIIDVGNWVVAEACRQLAEWDETVQDLRHLQVSVNVSARQLATPALGRVVAAALARTGLDPGRLCLEVTETAVLDDFAASFGVLTHLRAQGVSLAIDDFGTGYSSLTYLQRLPMCGLKIDGSFVTGLDRDPAKRAIVRSVIQLAHALELKVVAECVETSGEAGTLGELGCDLIQGYHVARPQSPDELVASWTAGRVAPGWAAGNCSE